eukprot:4644414-Pyramimonas_sp.AAC.1
MLEARLLEVLRPAAAEVPPGRPGRRRASQPGDLAPTGRQPCEQAPVRPSVGGIQTAARAPAGRAI